MKHKREIDELDSDGNLLSEIAKSRKEEEKQKKTACLQAAIAIIFFFMMFSTSLSMVSATNLTADLHAYFRFDSVYKLNNSFNGLYNLTDSSGGRAEASLTGGIADGFLNGTGITTIGDIMNFTYDYWSITKNGTVNMTISFFANQQGRCGSVNNVSQVMGRDSAFLATTIGYTQMFKWLYDCTGKNWVYYWGRGTAGSEASVTDGNVGSLGENTWYHIVMEITNTSWRVWQNGNEILTRTGLDTKSSGGVNWSGRSYIFAGNGISADNNPAANMTIDEFAVWNRSLTIDEIRYIRFNYLPFESDNVQFVSTNYNSTAYETSLEAFNVSVYYDSASYSAITGNLIYNTTTYSATKSGTGDNVVFTKDGVPITAGANSTLFYWNIKITNTTGTFSFNSTPEIQSVSRVHMALCNSTLLSRFVNFTFKDESTNSFIKANITNGIFYYWLGSAANNKSYSFTNSTGAPQYSLCFTPGDKTLNIFPYLAYSGSSYPQRVYNPFSSAFTNSTSNITLYSLSSIDGVSETIQVVNAADQPVSGVQVTLTRSVSGSEVAVGSGLTADDGAITFWLNPNYLHTVTASKTGYETATLTFTPTGAGRTLTLGGTSSAVFYNFNRGISYNTLPSNKTLLNNTSYTFEFTLASNYWTVTEYGFVMRNLSNFNLGSTSAATNGGTLSLNVNTGNNSMVIMDYYWVITSNYTNSSRSWFVLSDAGTDWSLKVFFEDIVSYMKSGMFGLKGFGLTLIVFLVIFTVTGIFSYKFGVTSPAAISALIFFMVLLFDVGLGLVGNPVGAVPHFPTIIIGFVFGALLIKEALQ